MWRAIAAALILMLLSSFTAIKNWRESHSGTFLSRRISFHNELFARFRIDMRRLCMRPPNCTELSRYDKSYGPTHKFSGERNAGAKREPGHVGEQHRKLVCAGIQ